MAAARASPEDRKADSASVDNDRARGGGVSYNNDPAWYGGALKTPGATWKPHLRRTQSANTYGYLPGNE